MKAFLMHPDRDFELERALPAHEHLLIQDLELHTLLSAMAAGDPVLFDAAKRALLLGLRDRREIAYRQAVLTDCLSNREIARELYALAGHAIKAERGVWSTILRDAPRSSLSSQVQKMRVLLEHLKQLRNLASDHAARFESAGFKQFFAMVGAELDDAYFQLIEAQLHDLEFKGGMLMSARLGAGNKAVEHVLRRPRQQGLLARFLDRNGYGFSIPDRDENGLRALGQLEDRAVNEVSNAIAQSVEHVLSFFVMLRAESGFYVGCMNLAEQLAQPFAFPVALDAKEGALSATGLYDVPLALTLAGPVVDNELEADGKSLVVITGANQGGKSTLLRSIGLAQLMMQAGMFVGAREFTASVRDGVFTHYKREEDESMERGKLDEELARMSDVADHITPNAMLLCNESFASTNEREGSQIATEVIDALVESGVAVLLVTHMFELANGFFERRLPEALFLAAGRGSDGARSFKITEGRPLPTSYGEDSYRKVFGRDSANQRGCSRHAGDLPVGS
jgi:hypothetical protein